jgi:hypothetical protein
LAQNRVILTMSKWTSLINQAKQIPSNLANEYVYNPDQGVLPNSILNGKSDLNRAFEQLSVAKKNGQAITPEMISAIGRNMPMMTGGISWAKTPGQFAQKAVSPSLVKVAKNENSLNALKNFYGFDDATPTIKPDDWKMIEQFKNQYRATPRLASDGTSWVYKEGGQMFNVPDSVKKALENTLYKAPEKYKTLVHYTDAVTPNLTSKNPNRLIPNSISLGKEGNTMAGVFGKNKFEVKIPEKAKTLKINDKNFFDFGKVTDTPINRGKAIYEYAKKLGYDIVRISSKVHGLGNEYAVINPDIVKVVGKK